MDRLSLLTGGTAHWDQGQNNEKLLREKPAAEQTSPSTNEETKAGGERKWSNVQKASSIRKGKKKYSLGENRTGTSFGKSFRGRGKQVTRKCEEQVAKR